MRQQLIRWSVVASALIVACGSQNLATPSASPTGAPQPAYPWAIPASCGITNMRLERRQGFPAYWIDGVKLAAGLPIGVLVDGENKIQWQGVSGELTIGGRLLDGTGEVQLVNPTRLGVGIYSTSTTFSHPGCWRLTATMGDGSFDAMVYVFPK